MDAHYTDQLHFGGGLRPKAESRGRRSPEHNNKYGPEMDLRPKTRKEMLEEMIAKSKAAKAERQHNKEASLARNATIMASTCIVGTRLFDA